MAPDCTSLQENASKIPNFSGPNLGHYGPYGPSSAAQRWPSRPHTLHSIMFGHYATNHTLMRLLWLGQFIVKMTKSGMEFFYFESGKCLEKYGISYVQMWRNPEFIGIVFFRKRRTGFT